MSSGGPSHALLRVHGREIMNGDLSILQLVGCFLCGALPAFAALVAVSRTVLKRASHWRHLLVIGGSLLVAFLTFLASTDLLAVNAGGGWSKSDRLRFAVVMGAICVLATMPLVSYAAFCFRAIPVRVRKGLFQFGALEIQVLVLAGVLVALVLCFPRALHHFTEPRSGTSDWSVLQLLWWNGGTSQPWRWWFGLGERIQIALLPCLFLYIVGLCQRLVTLRKDEKTSQSQQ